MTNWRGVMLLVSE